MLTLVQEAGTPWFLRRKSLEWYFWTVKVACHFSSFIESAVRKSKYVQTLYLPFRSVLSNRTSSLAVYFAAEPQ